METTNTGILVGLLTEEQKEQLVGQQYAPDSYFNPIQDDNDNWIISMEEITASDLSWIKELTLIEYVAKKPIEPNPAPTELNTEDQVAEVIVTEPDPEISPE